MRKRNSSTSNTVTFKDLFVFGGVLFLPTLVCMGVIVLWIYLCLVSQIETRDAENTDNNDEQQQQQ